MAKDWRGTPPHVKHPGSIRHLPGGSAGQPKGDGCLYVVLAPVLAVLCAVALVVAA